MHGGALDPLKPDDMSVNIVKALWPPWVANRCANSTAGNKAATRKDFQRHSATGTRTRVARVRAEYPSQLDYSGS